MDNTNFKSFSGMFLSPVGEVTQKYFALGLIGLYLALKYVLYSFLPEKLFYDSQKLLEMVQTGSFEEGSFGTTAMLLSYLPPNFLDWLTTSLGCALIYMLARAARTLRGQILIGLMLLPVMLLVLLLPTKDTFVVALSFIVLWLNGQKNLSMPIILLSIFALYALYGVGIRTYYILIVAAFAGLYFWPKIQPMFRLILIIFLLVLMLIAPSSLYDALQGPRDIANTYAIYLADVDVNTAFFNPFQPDNFLHFIGNYLTAMVLLNFPFIMSPSIKSVALFINIVTCAWLVVGAMRYGTKRDQLLAQLFAAHIVVLWLFEPDLGSYFRHSASVFAYLIPALALREERALKVQKS